MSLTLFQFQKDILSRFMSIPLDQEEAWAGFTERQLRLLATALYSAHTGIDWRDNKNLLKVLERAEIAQGGKFLWRDAREVVSHETKLFIDRTEEMWEIIDDFLKPWMEPGDPVTIIDDGTIAPWRPGTVIHGYMTQMKGDSLVNVLIKDFQATAQLREAQGKPQFDLNWHDGLLKELANQIYLEGDWDRLPILGDMLEEVEAPSYLVEHVRADRRHWRGCYVLSYLTGRA